MQNKGLIKLFAILFGIVSLYQLSFTWLAGSVESDAKEYAIAHAKKNDGRALAMFERKYLDSVANIPVFDNFGVKFSYNDIKDKEINLGLDLKGGINATLQVSVKDILIGLSNKSTNPTFNEALKAATLSQKNSTKSYLELFFQEFDRISQGKVKLNAPDIFGNKTLREKIDFNKSDAETKKALEDEINSSINTAFEVLRSRIDKFGVTQPNIQRIGNSGRILIELPGAKDIERVKRLLQSTAELQFWEVYSNQETAEFLYNANTKIAELKSASKKTVASTDSTSKKKSEIEDLLGEVKDSTASIKKGTDLFSVLYPRIPRNQNEVSSIIGTASVIDTAMVNKFLAMKEVRELLSPEMHNVKFLWDAKPIKDTEVINLYAIKGNRNNEAPIQGDVIVNASQEYDQMGTNPEVSMSMNSRGSKLWAKMTSDNVGKFVAVVLDNYVYTAPRVNTSITGGRTSISGNFTVLEAQDLANVLKAGKLPAAANIIQSEIVGPSLGQEAIDSGLSSFGFALMLVLVWMVFYYGKAGLYADIALAVNLLFIFGILSAFGAVLTLPGIAGIVLTIGMSVDANVLIFERIKEELANGKSLADGIQDGFSNALSSILDSNITTLLTGFVLFIFGTGPIKGFASTLMIGIATSLFSAIFITRLFIDAYTGKNKSLTFDTSITRNWFKKIDIEFLKKRKIMYVVSATVIIVGIGSLFTNGLNYGVDFVGGRSYVVRFDQAVNSEEVANSLKTVFGSSPEVKTYGTENQLKITTKYRINEEGQKVDESVQTALFNGVKPFLPAGTTIEEFNGGFEGQKIGVFNAIKVEPTIADDIKTSAQWAILGSLLIVFLYILLRFKKWQYSLGAVIAVFHDVLIVLSIFSIAYKFMPFDMEIDQTFIAAILTVIGYSLNDTVIIFDRIREFTNEHESWKPNDLVNKALSSTLGRTINTSLTTLIVLLAIFIFGGNSIRGFMFALIVGIIVGTYSSLFIASPIVYDTSNKSKEKNK